VKKGFHTGYDHQLPPVPVVEPFPLFVLPAQHMGRKQSDIL